MLRDVPIGVWLLSMEFFFVFFGFDPAQNLVAKNFPEYGDISVSVLYITFMVATLFSPQVIQRLGPHRTALVTPIGYTLFALATVNPIPLLFILGGISCGVAAAGLWVSGGCLIALESSENDRGRNNGIWLASPKVASVIGNLIAGVLMDTTSTAVVFAVCNIAIIVSHIPIYIYFRRSREGKLKSDKESEKLWTAETAGNSTEFAKKENKSPGPLAMAHIVAKTFIQPKRRYIWLLPLSIQTGLIKAWLVAMLPPRIEQASTIGYTRAVYALAFSLSGVLWG